MTGLVARAGLACALLSSSALAEPAPDARLAAPAGMSAYAWAEDAVYPLTATPGRITDIVLEPGESLAATGAIAAGDTARWVIGDTASGLGPARRVHVLVKPTQVGLATNLLINTDRRTYHLELRASGRTWQARVSWSYPDAAAPVLVSAPPARPSLDVSAVNRAYRIEGDHPAWRPVAVFDDGQRAYVEFGPGVVLGDLPPLYRVGEDGKSSQLVNYRVEGRRIVLDRLFDRVELRLGIKRQARRVRIIRLASAPEVLR
ncbi:P-type conjugative transfer protein TrbG [Caulobacter segnis]|uniref:P-type conjugative transfer protein TrbG n=1 Tax=Caulobacter segnis TaxID=88688 RepID=A0A2W5V965_9CAUL|nr:P-type conjugative transfer protein TrbG [Caulobacter segnis]PZR33236.1 MAG: P-type conjugative transfer protein TrbG [Caulobacter segnis]